MRGNYKKLEPSLNCCPFLDQLKLKTQMVVISTVSYGVFLLFMTTVCISVVIVTNAVFWAGGENVLKNQSNKNAGNILLGTSNLLSKYVSMSGKGFVGIIASAASDVFRNDYSMGYNPSLFPGNILPNYYEDGESEISQDNLCQPLVEDERTERPTQISLCGSSYYFPNMYVNMDYTNEQWEQVNRTHHTTEFFESLYRDYENFVSGYVALESTGLFRQYPATGTMTRDYDPRLRTWYSSAKSDFLSTEQKNLLYTEPYQDFTLKTWMITISRPIISPEFTEFIGVAGGDILIDEIRRNIDSLSFQKSGKVSLFENTGVVVADREWPADPNDPKKWTYSDLTNPPVDDVLWDKIRGSDSSENTYSFEHNIEGKDYLLSVNRLTGFGNKYIVVTFVLKSDVSEIINAFVDDIIIISVLTTVGLLVVFIVVSIVILILVVFFAKRIAKPLSILGNHIEKMLMNIGKGSLTDGMGDVKIDKGLGIGSEILELTKNYNTMINHLDNDESKKNVGLDLIDNEFFSGEHKYVKYTPKIEEKITVEEIEKLEELKIEEIKKEEEKIEKQEEEKITVEEIEKEEEKIEKNLEEKEE